MSQALEADMADMEGTQFACWNPQGALAHPKILVMEQAPVLQIRTATSEDADAILSCLASAFAAYRNEYTPKGFADTVLSQSSLQHRMKEMQLFVAVWEGEVVGTIGCQINGKEAHLRGMAVVPDRQGKGVAVALLRAVENHLRAHHCELITLDTTLPLKRATRFYEKHGFVPSGRISDFFGMPLYEFVKALKD